MNKSRVVFGAYVFLSSLYLLSYPLELSIIRLFIKPVLIPLLLGVYFLNSSPRKVRVVGALVLSFLGDVLLMGSGTLFFLGGLGSFLGAHLCYIREIWPDWKPLTIQQKILPILPYSIYAAVVLWVLFPVLDALKIPVLMYTGVLSVNGVLSLGLVLNRKSAWPIGVGVGLFVLSDTMIAFNSFYFDSEFFGGWVMATYLSAQALIISYFIGIKSIQ